MNDTNSVQVGIKQHMNSGTSEHHTGDITHDLYLQGWLLSEHRLFF
jgi:hypothetical protein